MKKYRLVPFIFALVYLNLFLNYCDLADDVPYGSNNNNSNETVLTTPPTISVSYYGDFKTVSDVDYTIMPIGNSLLNANLTITNNGNTIQSVKFYNGTNMLANIIDFQNLNPLRIDYMFYYVYGLCELYFKIEYLNSSSTLMNVHSETNKVYGYNNNYKSPEVTVLNSNNALIFRVDPSSLAYKRLYNITNTNNIKIYINGEFNNWTTNDNNYELHKDGDYYQITLTNISSNQQYQYYIDMNGTTQVVPDIYNYRMSNIGEKDYVSYVPSFKNIDLNPYTFTFNPSGNQYMGIEYTLANLVGSFNNWNTKVDIMTYNSESNRYEITKYLEDGSYYYYYQFNSTSNFNLSINESQKGTIYIDPINYSQSTKVILPNIPSPLFNISGSLSNVDNAYFISLSKSDTTYSYYALVDIFTPSNYIYFSKNFKSGEKYIFEIDFIDVSNVLDCNYEIPELSSNWVIPHIDPSIDYSKFSPSGNSTSNLNFTWDKPDGMGQISNISLIISSDDWSEYFYTNLSPDTTNFYLNTDVNTSGKTYTWSLMIDFMNNWNSYTIDMTYTIQ